MIPSSLLPLANHLWQSTLFAVAVGLLTLALRNNRAHVRYCLWLTASAKFLVPFSLLVFAGSQLGRHPAIESASFPAPLIMEQIGEQVGAPFGAEVSRNPVSAAPSSSSPMVPILIALWAAGCGLLVLSRWRHWRRIQRVFREASPEALAIGVPVRSSASFHEPGVYGLLRPVLLLPEGLAAQLDPAELQAILTHELCHIRRRDNLAAMLHMLVEAVFWFHPLVWWLGARLMDERERACDEEVVRAGSNPKAYAEGILKVCERYVRMPLPSVAGVTGANLKKRIEAIMNNGPARKLNFPMRAGLAMAGALAVAIPLVFGVALRAQQQSEERFEVASIRRVEIPATANGGVRVFPPEGGIGTSNPLRITYRGTWLPSLMAQAFGVQPNRITGPDWLSKERYDVIANIPEGATKEQFNRMLGNLLRDRFHLRFHIESRDDSVYVLRVARNGPKLKETARKADDVVAPGARIGVAGADGFPTLPPGYHGMVAIPRPGEIFISAQDYLVVDLARSLEQKARRPIVDETGLTGRYDFKLHHEWINRGPVTEPSRAPSVFTAVEEQLGLKLESATRPLDHLIIDSMDREPTEN